MKRIVLELTMLFGLMISLSSCGLSDLHKSGTYSITGTITTISGTAVDSNVISGVSISAGSKNTTSGSDGSYTINGLGRSSVSVSAKKTGYTLIPAFENTGEGTTGSYINVGQVADHGVVYNANFIAVKADSLAISDIQGSSLTSPLTGCEVTVKGVVTMVCHKSPNFLYDTTSLDGSNVAQYVGEDGFYIEALPDQRDYTGKKSNGIFIDTHDSSFDESKWISSCPTDLQAGDVVIVKGCVAETRKMDRFGSSTGNLTRTVIKAENAYHYTKNGTNVTAGYPLGVLLTYSQAKADSYIANTYTYTDENGDTKTYNAEARVMVGDLDSSKPMQDAIDVLESVENMVIVIDNPRVVGATYYNLTTVLADDGTIGDTSSVGAGSSTSSTYFRTYNSTWQGDVIQWNYNNGQQDFNEELLFVDYQAFDWKAGYGIAQIGDHLKDSTGKRVFRGVMDYTGDGIYMAHPLNTKSGAFVQNASYANNYLVPYYTNSTGNAITDVKGDTVPPQSWNFDTTGAWYTLNGLSLASSMNSSGSATSYTSTSTRGNAVKAVTLGTASGGFNANPLFTPGWSGNSSTSTGNTEANSLTVASYNLENYTEQGSSNSKNLEITRLIKNNLLYPDVLVTVEMGDDKTTPGNYVNQDNEWALIDGTVTAVRNYSDLIDQIKKTQSGPEYEFRCIDPIERDSGGKAGVNIRVGFMYNTNNVEFIDRGIETNHYTNTHDSSGNFIDESDWPVNTGVGSGEGAYGNISVETLAQAATSVYMGDDGVVHLTQSPCYLQDSSFSHSRRPLVGEFKHKATGETFYVIACHLSSKRADYALYGELQPPLLLSEASRNKQGQAVYEFVKRILTLDPDAKIIVAGDMNDFAYSTPLRVLTGQKANDQILYSPEEEFMPVEEQFSYAYNGNLQEIDHIYVTKSLFNKMRTAGASSATWSDYVFVPHVDSMVSRNNHFNVSDHDPAVIRIPGAFN